MRNSMPTISIPVDVTNPGQFFACCGLFELADRLWPGAEAWFDGEAAHSRFHILALKSRQGLNAADGPTLCELLSNACALRFDVGNDEGSSDGADQGDDDSLLDPIVIQSPVQLILDWWSDKSIKPWAGSMKAVSYTHLDVYKRQRLAQVLLFEIGVVLEQFLAIGIAGEDVQDVLDGDAQAANAGLAAHLARFDGDAVERGFEGHELIVALQ